MSWLYSRVLVEDSSVDISLDGEQCALWNGTHMQRASWLPAKMTDACLLSRSGMMYKPLTDDLGEELLMSYLEGFRARISQVQEREPVLTESEAGCGDTWQESLAKYDPSSSSWKTAHCLFQEDLPESSVTLPKWGMMQNGECWERTMSLPPTRGTGSGSWPTPTVDDSSNVTRRSGKFQSLTRRVMFPTPQANEDAAGTPNGKMQRMLGNCKEIRGKTAEEWAGGTLNPNWVEWLMGWPIGWTDLNPLGMDKFQQWLDLHGMS